MTKKPEIQIFLAHASEDKELVRDLYRKLQQEGYSPWLDEEDLLPGQLWRDEIPKAIRNCDFFIACLSEKSIAKRGYIQKEFKMALNYCAERAQGDIYLIPLKLSHCQIPDLRQEEYGIYLRDYQWLDYFNPDGFKRLIQAIEFQREKMKLGLQQIIEYQQKERADRNEEIQYNSQWIRKKQYSNAIGNDQVQIESNATLPITYNSVNVRIPAGGIMPGLFTNDLTQLMTPEDAALARKHLPFFKRSGPGLLVTGLPGCFIGIHLGISYYGIEGALTGFVIGAAIFMGVPYTMTISGLFDTQAKRAAERAIIKSRQIEYNTSQPPLRLS